MHPYAIGLDIGITSVGWAALALDGSENPCGILGMGSRIFDAAEQPKTGESLAAPRRDARGSRRRLRRHRHRNERIKSLMLAEELVSPDELSSLFAVSSRTFMLCVLKLSTAPSAALSLREYYCTYLSGAVLNQIAKIHRRRKMESCSKLSAKTSSAWKLTDTARSARCFCATRCSKITSATRAATT